LISIRDRIFSSLAITSRPALRPTRGLVDWVSQERSLGLKCHAEVENAWVDLYLHSPVIFHDVAFKLRISFAEGSVSGGNVNGA
jgi:hypothetical protein